LIPIKKYIPTYSRTDLPLPFEDPRINPSPKLTWEQLQETRRSMLQAYQITVSKILSRVEGIEIASLKNELIYEYCIPSNIVDDLVSFITTNDTKKIEFDEVDRCKKDLLYLKPRIRVSVVGSSSPYVAQGKFNSLD
jgi:hypothetical protein